MTNEERQCLVNAQMMILREIRRICEKHKLRYFLAAGSMLGAIRHKGCIPWDDDMDVGMPREDYEKFLELVPAELGPEFYCDNYRTNDDSYLVFTKIRLLGTTFVEARNNLDAEHQEIFVDLLPYYYLAEDEKQRKREGFIMLFVSRMLQCKGHYRPWLGEHWTKRVKNVVFEVASWFMTKKAMFRVIEHYYYKHNNTSYMGIHSGSDYMRSMYPASVFTSLLNVPFEDDLFPVSAQYDLYLSRAYGDYMAMPPAEVRAPKHPALKLDFGPYGPKKAE